VGTTKLYVTNIPLSVAESSLVALFARHGSVRWAKLATDPLTGRSRGFGIVEMATPEQAQEAAALLDHHVMDGRCLTVSQAEPLPGPGRPMPPPKGAR
jgi:RNA recognition motif-containing protein